MEDETLGFLRNIFISCSPECACAGAGSGARHYMIRGLDVLMIFNTLGVRGIGEFIHRSVQTRA
ncbi:hypothetical protein ECZU01_49040 [Escherichia coli]|nr:hypothetical protein ECZU01_49040 [Escherichia coli]